MPKKESNVTRNVRETVVKAASEIDRLRTKFNKKTAPLKQRIHDVEKEIFREVSQKRGEMKIKAKKLSRQAVRTTKDAIKGFKEGVDIVRRSKHRSA